MGKFRNISASEIGEYAYCPRAWAYKKLGYPSENRKEMDKGSRFHHEFGMRERLIRVLRVIVIIAMLVLMALIIRRFLR